MYTLFGSRLWKPYPFQQHSQSTDNGVSPPPPLLHRRNAGFAQAAPIGPYHCTFALGGQVFAYLENQMLARFHRLRAQGSPQFILEHSFGNKDEI